MLKTNLRNQIRQTVLPKWKPLLPLFEAIMNSFQALRELPDQEKIKKIRIQINRTILPLGGEVAEIDGFAVSDNGIGLDDTNFDSFNTAYSDHKLRRGGKGLGRLSWLKAFESASIESIFLDGTIDKGIRRSFVFDENYDPDTLSLPSQVAYLSSGTTVTLKGFKEPYRSACPQSAEQVALKIVEHFLLLFLEEDCPEVTIEDGGLVYSANELFRNEFQKTATQRKFSIKGSDFTLTGFRLTTPKLMKHRLVYAADQRAVISDNLADYLPNLASRLPDSQGNTFVYLGIIQSEYLTSKVNPNRTDIDFGSADDSEVEQPSLLGDDSISRTEIRERCLVEIQDDLKNVLDQMNAAKAEKVSAFVKEEAPQYRILLKNIDEIIDRIPTNPTKVEMDTALHREIYNRETKLRSDSNRIIKEAAKLDDYDAYSQKLTEFLEGYNELGVSALARYVSHRKIILDLLARAIEAPASETAFPLEQVVHHLVFPMRATSADTPLYQQNLWIIDERLTHHSLIESDKQLRASSMVESNSARRPDLAIFDERLAYAEGKHPINSIITVEFKRPMRDDYNESKNPVLQSFKLVDDIRSGKFKTKGQRPVSVSNESIPAFCYAICDVTDTLKSALKVYNAIPTPGGDGFFGYSQPYNAYFEVISYNKLLRDAQQRNRAFFDSLNYPPG